MKWLYEKENHVINIILTLQEVPSPSSSFTAFPGRLNSNCVILHNSHNQINMILTLQEVPSPSSSFTAFPGRLNSNCVILHNSHNQINMILTLQEVPSPSSSFTAFPGRPPGRLHHQAPRRSWSESIHQPRNIFQSHLSFSKYQLGLSYSSQVVCFVIMKKDKAKKKKYVCLRSADRP